MVREKKRIDLASAPVLTGPKRKNVFIKYFLKVLFNSGFESDTFLGNYQSDLSRHLCTQKRCIPEKLRAEIENCMNSKYSNTDQTLEACGVIMQTINIVLYNMNK